MPRLPARTVFLDVEAFLDMQPAATGVAKTEEPGTSWIARLRDTWRNFASAIQEASPGLKPGADKFLSTINENIQKVGKERSIWLTAGSPTSRVEKNGWDPYFDILRNRAKEISGTDMMMYKSFKTLGLSSDASVSSEAIYKNLDVLLFGGTNVLQRCMVVTDKPDTAKLATENGFQVVLIKENNYAATSDLIKDFINAPDQVGVAPSASAMPTTLSDANFG